MKRAAIFILTLAACTPVGGEEGMAAKGASARKPVDKRRPLVGAIRWDAWHGERGMPGRAVERALEPKKWHGRLPFFAKVAPGGKVKIDGSSQEVMDAEIACAVRAGLDYWAFVTYPKGSSMSIGLKRYLASARRGEMGFCLVTEQPRWTDPAFVRRVTTLVAESGYQKVAGGRPLLYLGFIDEGSVEKAWGGAEGFRKVLDGFRADVTGRGLEQPYIAIMDFDPNRGAGWARKLGCDAVTSYAASGGGRGAPYAELARYVETFWDRCRATGSQVVPVVMSGWDRRPRVERPMPWETWQKPGAGLDRFYHAPRPEELAGHLGKALEWLAANRTSAEAQATIVYAWNENDEGGWLVPTLDEGAARLEAIAEVLARR